MAGPLLSTTGLNRETATKDLRSWKWFGVRVLNHRAIYITSTMGHLSTLVPQWKRPLFYIQLTWLWRTWASDIESVFICVYECVYMRAPYLLCVSGWYMKLNLSVGCPLAILAVCKWGRSGSGYANLKLKQREVMITTNRGKGKTKEKKAKSKHQCNSKWLVIAAGLTVIWTVRESLLNVAYFAANKCI